MGDKIHPTHFQVPEMPWREKERQAILMLKELLIIIEPDSWEEDTTFAVRFYLKDKQELIDWIMKYKGE